MNDETNILRPSESVVCAVFTVWDYLGRDWKELDGGEAFSILVRELRPEIESRLAQNPKAFNQEKD